MSDEKEVKASEVRHGAYTDWYHSRDDEGEEQATLDEFTS